MKIVIEIPDEVKHKIDKNLNACDLDIYDCVMTATKNGTPLPKGHWILKEDKHYYCSECNDMGVDYWDYCPNCGADMRGEQE